MTTPTPPAAAPTLHTDQIEAESRAEFLHFHKAPKDWLIVTEKEIAEIKRELAAKDARIAALEKDKAQFQKLLTNAFHALNMTPRLPMYPAFVAELHKTNIALADEILRAIEAAREGQK